MSSILWISWPCWQIIIPLTRGIQFVSRVSNMVHGPLVFNKPNLLGAIIKILWRKKIPYKIIIHFLKWSLSYFVYFLMVLLYLDPAQTKIIVFYSSNKNTNTLSTCTFNIIHTNDQHFNQLKSTTQSSQTKYHRAKNSKNKI